ncbi:MAG: preprotein translocase subunit SecE [Kineosporiaceae bacterium]
MTTTTSVAKDNPAPKGPRKKNPGRMARLLGTPARIRLFLRQVISELRKVVRPTRKELTTYTTVVLAFVVIMMVFVSILDFGFGKLVLWAFGGGDS